MLEHHPLVNEFPEHHETLHKLKTSDNHYHKMMQQYDDIDKQIFRIESNEEIAAEIKLENLKKERLQLKDCILSRVKQIESIAV